MISRLDAFLHCRHAGVLLVALAIGLSVACSGREDDGQEAASTEAPRATPPSAVDSPTDGEADDGTAGPLFTNREARDLAALVQQRRETGQLRDKPIRISPEPGRNTIDWPEDLPQDIPFPDSASPTRYVFSEQDGRMMTAVIDESPGSAHGYFLDELEAEGWYVQTTGATDDLTMLSAYKGDRVMAVAITIVEGETTVTLLESRE